jgi:hypothetical protein
MVHPVEQGLALCLELIARRLTWVMAARTIMVSSSVNGLLIEDITNREGPCQSISLRTFLKDNPTSVRLSKLDLPCSVPVSS